MENDAIFISLESFTDINEKQDIIKLINKTLDKDFIFINKDRDIYSTCIEGYIKDKISNQSKVLLEIAEINEFYDKKIKKKLDNKVSVITENYFDGIILNNNNDDFTIKNRNIVNLYSHNMPDLIIVKYDLTDKYKRERNYIKKHTNRAIGVFKLNNLEFINGLKYHFNLS